MSSAEWHFRLLGEFLILSPSGDEVKIPSRKARALVALLALNNGIAVSREWLGRELWADKPRLSQQQNLRQAISAIPRELIDAARETCRISVTYRCDALECLDAGKDPGNLTLLPEMPEEIFDSYRSELASFAPSGKLGEAVRAAASLLEWATVSDPGKIIELLQGCQKLIPNMPLPLLERALRAGLRDLDPDHASYCWGMVQLASVLMWAGQCDEGIKVAKRTLDGWEPESDDPQWTTAAYSAATFLIFRGRLDKALTFIDAMASLAKSHGFEEAQRRFIHAKALWFGYGGNIDQALLLLESLPPSDIVCLHRALYYSLVPDAEKGRLAMASVSDLEAGNVRLESQARVALGYLLLAEGKRDEARVIFTEAIDFCETYGLELVRIHAIEGLALCAEDQVDAQSHLGRAEELRNRQRFPLLPGDRRRLAGLLES